MADNFKDNERDALYKRFREAMLHNPSDTFFDECDLIEVFDYAGDLNDDATRTEVIALASRLYPQSEDIKIRKAMFYYFVEQDDMARELLNGPHISSPLWDILAMHLDDVDESQVDNRLTQILKRHKHFDDEDIIQLITLAQDYGRLDWAIANLDQLKARTRYQPTLLYEIAAFALMNDDFEQVIKLTDELTSLEPFYAPHWLMRARAFASLHNVQEATSAIDLALAIDAEWDEAVLLKSQLMLLSEPENIKEILPKMEKLYNDNPDNLSITRTLAVIYKVLLREDDACTLYITYLSKHPGERQLLEDALDTLPSVKALMTRYYNEGPENQTEADWVDMANTISSAGGHAKAVEILEVFHQNEGLTFGFDNLAAEMYMAGQYSALIEMLSQSDNNGVNVSPTPVSWLVFTLSALRTGDTDLARQAINFWTSLAYRACTSPFDRIRTTGATCYMRSLSDLIDSDEVDSKHLDALDPFKPISSTPPQWY